MTLHFPLLYIKITLYLTFHHTCGVLLDAISKKLDRIVEFTAFEDFIGFERKGKNMKEYANCVMSCYQTDDKDDLMEI